MKPVNNKSLISFLFSQMDKLENKEISVLEAQAQAKLASQINLGLRYELDRVKTQVELEKHIKDAGSHISLREVESKNFE